MTKDVSKNAKAKRNQFIVDSVDKLGMPFLRLSKELNMDRKTVREIYYREKLRNGEKNVPLWVHKRYKKLSTKLS